MEGKEAPSPVLRIERTWKKERYTIGRWYVDGVLWFNSLEDRDRGLHSGMSVVSIKAKKVYGETAIPRGTYEVRLSYSPKFAGKPWGKRYGGLVPEILHVKGFSGVRIHPMNRPEESLGCIGPGHNTVVGQITNSIQCYYRLMDEVFVPAHKAGRTVTLDII